MRDIKEIIIHCSASDWGNADVIDEWHRERGFDEIGYHFVIMNGKVSSDSKYRKAKDGMIEQGRDIEVQGAHCLGHNSYSIGICLIGNEAFTAEQLFTSLPFLLGELMQTYSLSKSDIHCHYEFSNKTCPNVPIERIRELLS